MVGNTYSYTSSDWTEDIELASSHGIDGFALNVGSDTWQPKHVAAAYAAASGSAFKLFLSFDMTSLPGSSRADATFLRELILACASSPNQLKWDGKIVVSTFGGEKCTFGERSVGAGWHSAVKDGMPPVHFIPSFFDHSLINDPVLDGFFHWNGGWPMGNHDIDFRSDGQHVAINHGKIYMAAVSPWFFTHYGPDSWNKNWIYRGDGWLYNRRWEILVREREHVDIVQILSWNDYGESHYIGPIRSDQPNSQAWVDGFDHQGWLEMTEYYATAFKTGSYPTIHKDKLYLWARPHPASATAVRPAASKPKNAHWTQDYLWAVVFAVAPAQVTLISGSTSTCFEVPSGVTKLKVPCSPGAQCADMSRDRKILIQLRPMGFNFRANPEAYNFNAFVAASP
ncbi:alpha-1,3-glucanase [Gautieria morchelliformis]|nr:alpha-1,3-glucanase [Gautieria morchelliformis]